MAVVPDRRLALTSRLDNLEKNRSILEKTIQQLTNSNATAVAIKLEHNTCGPLETHSVEVNGNAIKSMDYEDDDADREVQTVIKHEQIQNQEANDAEVEIDETGEWPVEDEGKSDGRPVTRAASRAAAAAAVQSKQLRRNRSATFRRELGSPVPSSSPTSICIDLTEGEICAATAAAASANNNSSTSEEGVITRRRSIVKETSKYPTRSSTKRDTLASHALANTRTSGASLNRDESSTTAFLTTENLTQLLAGIEAQARACSTALAEEESKRQSYRVDAARRIHNYEPFIRAFLKELKEQGMLQRLVGEANASISSGRQLRKRRTPSMTPQKPVWSSSSAVSTSSSSTNGDTSVVGSAGGALSRLAVKRARLTAVANRPSTRMSSATGNSTIAASMGHSSRVGSKKKVSRRSL